MDRSMTDNHFVIRRLWLEEARQRASDTRAEVEAQLDAADDCILVTYWLLKRLRLGTQSPHTKFPHERA